MRGNEGIKEIFFGLSLCIMVTLYDVLWTGIRGFFEYAISWKGMLIWWVGLAFITYGAIRNWQQWR